MGWWIYENWTVERGGKTIVHEGACAFCKEGRGIHKEDSGRNGKWHGPFDTKEAAYSYARQLGRARTDFCSFCSKAT